MPLVRRLKPAGMAQFEEFLNSLNTPSPQLRPDAALEHDDTSEPLGIVIEIEAKKFGTRLEAARYLDSKLSDSGLKDIERDRALWAWLSLFFFVELCPADRSGRRKPGEKARYLLEPLKARRYYKHLLAGPYLIYRAHRDNQMRALAFLFGPLSELSEFVNQLASKQELVTNKSLLAAVTRLFIDPQTKRPKRGSASKGPGGARRLALVMNQFDLTWDLCEISEDMFLRCLPQEFSKFKPIELRPGGLFSQR
jgi:hypothetical protein